MDKHYMELVDDAIEGMIKEHGIAVEELTERQLAGAIKQAILAGDFVRHVSVGGGQAVVYIPGMGVDNLRERVRELEEKLSEKGEEDKWSADME